MSWQVLLGISMLTFSFGVLLQKTLLKDSKTNPIAFSFLSQLGIGFIILLFSLSQGFHMPNFLPFLPNVLLMVFLYVVLNIFAYTSLKIIDASKFTILFSTRAIWTIIPAVIFLGETFSLQAVFATILIFISVIIVSYKKKRIAFGKGEFFALLAAGAIGIAFANDAYLIRNFDVLSYLVFSYFLPGIATGIVSPKSMKDVKKLLTKSFLIKLAVLDFLYAISSITIYLAYKSGNNAAQIGAINQTSTIIIVCLSIVLLRETSNLKRKIVGALLAFIGVLLLR